MRLLLGGFGLCEFCGSVCGGLVLNLSLLFGGLAVGLDAGLVHYEFVVLGLRFWSGVYCVA